MENVGVKLVRQAGAKTNNLAGDGSTTSVILAHGLIAEGQKVTTTSHKTSGASRAMKFQILIIEGLEHAIPLWLRVCYLGKKISWLLAYACHLFHEVDSSIHFEYP